MLDAGDQVEIDNIKCIIIKKVVALQRNLNNIDRNILREYGEKW